MDIDNLKIFLTFLEREKGQGERTRQTNLKMIRKILRLIPSLSSEETGVFISNLIQKKAAPSYIKQHIGVIRQWGECFNLPDLKEYPYPKIPYKSDFERSTFSDKEMIDFLNLPNPYKSTSLYKQTKNNKGVYYSRYEMMIMFYTIKFYHGFRDWETARLEVNMMDFGIEDAIKLPGRIVKTKKSRKVPFSPAVRDKIYNYVQRLEGTHLFPNPRDPTTHILPNYWTPFFRNQINRMGIKRDNLDSYSTRHTYGTRQARRVPLKTLSMLMGHSNTSTTERYIHPGLDDFKEAQDNDTILDYHKNGKAILVDIHKKQKSLEEKYRGKIYTVIEMSENGKELIVKFKVKRQASKEKYTSISINFP